MYYQTIIISAKVAISAYLLGFHAKIKGQVYK